jgi:S-adenosylmethionine-diacylgycerolhomoserine-N-methlytransferase
MTMVSAASAMDRMYRRQRHIYDFSRKYYLLGRDRMIRGLDLQPGETALEIGCGTGRNLVYAAKQFPRARFYGIDVSREMLATAQAAVDRAGLNDRVRLAYADATQFDAPGVFQRETFDRVFISYTLSMIPAWRNVLESAVPLLGQSGSLHIVDFGDQEGWPSWFRSGLRRWLAAFDVTPRDELETMLRSHDLLWTLERPYRGYAQHAVIAPR